MVTVILSFLCAVASGTSAAALTRLGEGVLFLRLLGNNRNYRSRIGLGAAGFGLGALETTPDLTAGWSGSSHSWSGAWFGSGQAVTEFGKPLGGLAALGGGSGGLQERAGKKPPGLGCVLYNATLIRSSVGGPRQGAMDGGSRPA